MKTIVATILFLSFSLGLAGQSQRAKSKNPAMSPSASPIRRDLNTSLADLERVTAATNSDIGNFSESGSSRWKMWQKLNSRKRDEKQMAAAIQRNLTNAMPVLIHDVQSSRGSVSTTFKLYNNLNVVYETLDSLVETGDRDGKKRELGPLTNDLAAMGHVRQELSAYIEQASISLDNKRQSYGAANATSAPARRPAPKKVVFDGMAPETRPARQTASLSDSAPPPAAAPAPKKIIIDDNFDDNPPRRRAASSDQ